MCNLMVDPKKGTHTTGGFMILDTDSKEVIQARQYYGPRWTNNKADSCAIWDTLQSLSKLVQERPSLRHPIRVFGDSQLMIHFLTRVFKQP